MDTFTHQIQVQEDPSLIFTPITAENISIFTAMTCSAFWDTGSTYSSISERVVQALSLTSIGKRKTRTYDSIVEAHIFAVDLKLPKFEKRFHVEASGVSSSKDFDVIIGMDMIRQGSLVLEQIADMYQLRFTFDV